MKTDAQVLYDIVKEHVPELSFPPGGYISVETATVHILKAMMNRIVKLEAQVKELNEDKT